MLNDLAKVTYAGARDEEDYYASLQRTIDNGSIWHMEGSAGRGAMDAINAGLCMVGERPMRDYWGNVVPSRSMLKPGTKGTRDYVVERHGDAWANLLERASKPRKD